MGFELENYLAKAVETEIDDIGLSGLNTYRVSESDDMDYPAVIIMAGGGSEVVPHSTVYAMSVEISVYSLADIETDDEHHSRVASIRDALLDTDIEASLKGHQSGLEVYSVKVGQFSHGVGENRARESGLTLEVVCSAA